MTIQFPDELSATARLVGYRSWPLIDEDQLRLHAKSWLAAGASFRKTVNYDAANQADTIFDPQSAWVRGHDQPLDTFMKFWQSNPQAHYNSAADQAPVVAGSLNNVAGIISAHKVAAINALQNGKNDLSQRYHLLGDSENAFVSFFGVHGTETLDTEDATARKEDQTTITVLGGYLRQLVETTREQIDEQVMILDKVTTTLDGISASVTKTSGELFYPQDAPQDPAKTAQLAALPTDYQAWLAAGSNDTPYNPN
jgi:hypothetical protein